MSDQYVAEIRMVGFNFAPVGWALCNGQLMPISQNLALFSLLGTTYGGDGKSNFALPNLQALTPMGYGNGAGLTPRVWGQTGGEYTVTLQGNQIAAHNHGVNCNSGPGSANTVAGNLWATNPGRGAQPIYGEAGTPVPMNSAAVQLAGSSQPHNNLQPYLTVYFIIALKGFFPQRS